MAPLHQTIFASTDERYICFFGCCHIWRSAACLGILTAVWLLANIIQVLVVYSSPGISAIFLSIFLALLILYAVLTGFMLYGLKSERPKFILPFLQFQVLSIIVCIGLIILCIISLASSKRNDGDLWYDSIHTFAIVLLIELIAGIIFQAIVFYVIYKCYNYLRDSIDMNENLITIGQTNARFTNQLVTLSNSDSINQMHYYNPALIYDIDDVPGTNKAMP